MEINRLLSTGILAVGMAWIGHSCFAATAAPGMAPNGGGVRPANAKLIASLASRLAAHGATPLGWSARGELLIASRTGQTRQLSLLTDTAGSAHVRQRPLSFFHNPIRDGAFSPNPWLDEFLFTKNRDGRANYRLYVQSTGSRHASALTAAKNDVRDAVWSNSGKQLAFAAHTRDGESVELMAPEARAVARVVVAGSDAYPVPLDWSPGDRRLLVRSTLADGEIRLYTIDIASGQRRDITAPHNRAAIPEARFSRDGLGVYLITADGANYRGLHYVDLATGRQSLVAPGDGGDVERFALSRDGRRLAYTQIEGDGDRLRVVDLGKHRELPLPPLPSVGRVESLHFDPAGRRLAFAFSAPNRPRNAFVIDLTGERLEAWTHNELGAVSAAEFIAPRLTRFPTFDSVDGRSRQLPVYLYEPAGAGKHPALILFHAGAEGDFRPEFNPWIQFVVHDLGYAVVAPNLRGSSGFGAGYAALGEGWRRADVLKDIGALLVWLQRQPGIDAHRVVVAGRGYGGYLALMAAVDYSARLRGVVDFGGMTDLPTYLDDLRPPWQAIARSRFGDERDPGVRLFLRDLSPLALADRITVPALIAHGRNDRRVNVSQSMQMADLLRSRHVRVRVMIARHEGRRLRRQADRIAFYTKFARFLDKVR
ncbi:MAG: S9 family peptidase [Steroidobacteraceae bacterium]|nr:S9 family peptidase [Steroidobacteraceae bacterium]